MIVFGSRGLRYMNNISPFQGCFSGKFHKNQVREKVYLFLYCLSCPQTLCCLFSWIELVVQFHQCGLQAQACKWLLGDSWFPTGFAGCKLVASDKYLILPNSIFINMRVEVNDLKVPLEWTLWDWKKKKSSYTDWYYLYWFLKCYPLFNCLKGELMYRPWTNNYSQAKSTTLPLLAWNYSWRQNIVAFIASSLIWRSTVLFKL